MTYSECEKIESNPNTASADDVKRLCAAYKKTLEALFEIAITGTTSCQSVARFCMDELGLFGDGNEPPTPSWANQFPRHEVVEQLRKV